MRNCKHERYSRPDAYCPDCDVSWEIVERDQRIKELEAVVERMEASDIRVSSDNEARLEAENQRLLELLDKLRIEASHYRAVTIVHRPMIIEAMLALLEHDTVQTPSSNA